MFKEVKNIKQIIVVVIILIIYCIGVSYFISKRNGLTPNNKPNNDTPKPVEPKVVNTTEIDMVITPNTILSYKNGKWYENKDIDFTKTTFDVYADKTYSNLQLTYTDKWYIMEKDRNFIDYSDETGFVAISSDNTYKGITAGTIDDNDNVIIKAFLDGKNIKFNEATLKKSIYNYDVNDDGVNDRIYVLSNVFLDDYAGYDKTFAYAFVRSLNQNIIMYEDVNNNINAMNMCDPSIRGELSFKEDKITILDCAYISNTGTKHILYKMEDKTVNKLFESKAN